MNVKIRKSNSWIKERVSRFKPVVLLKRNYPLLIFILLVCISFIFGLWDIKNYSICDIQGESIDGKVYGLVSEYFEKNVTGRNFFTIYAKKLEDDLARNISYVKSARVVKDVPNKLEVFINLYEPKSLVHDRDDHCKLLSSSGIVLDELCTDTPDKLLCCKGYSSDGKYYLFKSDQADTSKLPSGKEQLLVMNGISDVVEVVESYGFRVKEVVLENKVITLRDMDEKKHIFSLSEDINTQLARYFVVMGRVKSEGMNFSSIDVRFERPVVKN